MKRDLHGIASLQKLDLVSTNHLKRRGRTEDDETAFKLTKRSLSIYELLSFISNFEDNIRRI